VGEPGEPHTPPSAATLWAKRRGSQEESPGSLPDNLQLLSLRGSDQWQDLQSPLDVFARKHCPSRSRTSASSVQTGSGHSDRPSALCETDEDACSSPSWARPNNHSPLAALLRREFPAPNKAGAPSSERRLFDDL